MIIGVPKEIKDNEARVGMVPDGVKQLVDSGHTVLVETDAGLDSGFTNDQYQQHGAKIVSTEKAWAVDLVVKVKEPQESEYPYLRSQIVFTFFHLAGVSKSLTEVLIRKRVTAIAYETLEDQNGGLPLLQPMSAVAGNMSVLMGAYYLARFNQGKGMQLGRVLGETYGKVLIVGDGTVGQHAARVASAMGAEVIVFGLNEKRWWTANKELLGKVQFIVSNQENISKHLLTADLLVGAVLCRGEKAPKIISEGMVKTLPAGSVLVDVSIDQGGCIETSRPTTHTNPVYLKHGVVHYCVANMPGAYPRTSTLALTNATIRYIKKLADHGVEAFACNDGMRKAINIQDGKIKLQTLSADLALNN